VLYPLSYEGLERDSVDGCGPASLARSSLRRTGRCSPNQTSGQLRFTAVTVIAVATSAWRRRGRSLRIMSMRSGVKRG
jgi:hypothetical protein